MEVTFKLDQWDIQSELVFVVDETVFTEERAQVVNEFWCDSDGRFEDAGSHVMAALTLYAVECFRQVAFNNFKTAAWVMAKFDWSKEGQGVEGFFSFEEAGLKLKEIEPWHIEFEHVERVEP
ncbi:DUF2528 family protein [Aeromonas enteropelogenes]|uniref:DUF2528 family protein n=1 Tax=Aeromonas enteropelogenes TaxID=29489 RepID=UPI003B9E9A6F